ncbi:hypothetical protein DFJ73DRAFT_957692 [Zopfochytrium polystomum]|nr:hypothetical protein DFJ73DRAFT_957692 [Zopfochytrium polystomum]
MITATAILLATLLFHARLAQAVNWAYYGEFYLVNCNPTHSLVARGDNQPVEECFIGRSGDFIHREGRSEGVSFGDGSPFDWNIHSDAQSLQTSCRQRPVHQFSWPPVPAYLLQEQHPPALSVAGRVPLQPHLLLPHERFYPHRRVQRIVLAKGPNCSLSLANPSVDTAPNFALAQPKPNNAFVITDRNGLCVNVYNGRTDNGAPVALWPCSYTATAYNEQWIPVSTPDGGFFLHGVQRKMPQRQRRQRRAGDSLILWDFQFDSQSFSNTWLSAQFVQTPLCAWAYFPQSHPSVSKLSIAPRMAQMQDWRFQYGFDGPSASETTREHRKRQPRRPLGLQLHRQPAVVPRPGFFGGLALVNKASGRCLNVNGGNFVDGALEIYHCLPGAASIIWIVCTRPPFLSD